MPPLRPIFINSDPNLHYLTIDSLELLSGMNGLFSIFVLEKRNVQDKKGLGEPKLSGIPDKNILINEFDVDLVRDNSGVNAFAK